MKLNPDCIRDILLDVEKRSTYHDFVNYTSPDDFQNLAHYSSSEIFYHIRQADAHGYFLGKVSYYWGDGCTVKDLSPLGHEFLANIRQDTNWQKTKEIANKVGSSSLDVLKDISAQVISSLISSQFNK